MDWKVPLLRVLRPWCFKTKRLLKPYIHSFTIHIFIHLIMQLKQKLNFYSNKCGLSLGCIRHFPCFIFKYRPAQQFIISAFYNLSVAFDFCLVHHRYIVLYMLMIKKKSKIYNYIYIMMCLYLYVFIYPVFLVLGPVGVWRSRGTARWTSGWNISYSG